MTQTTLLSCVEEMVGVSQPHLLVFTPLIIQALYESDVLEEDAILAWHESPPESSYMVNKDVAVNVRAKVQRVFVMLSCSLAYRASHPNTFG